MKRLIVAPALALAAGCAPFAQATCDRAMTATAELRSAPEVPEVPEDRSNLGLDVSSNLPRTVGMTVTFDQAVALDAELPAVHPTCAHHAIHRYSYDLPDDVVAVTVTTDEGERATTEVELGDRPRWLVVTVQEGFPLDVETWDERPEHG